MPPHDRHAALADPSRRALLDALRRSGGPRDVRWLAQQVGLHPNSVREQLTRLADAGLVRVSSAVPSGRGRPRHRYAAASEASVEPHRVLSSALAEGLAGVPDAAERSAAAGERWGREAAASLAADPAVAGTGTTGTIGAVVELMAEAGFAPGPVEPGQRELALHACPFLPIEPGHLAVVCGVHLGFLRGALRQLGAPAEAVSIHPFSTPDTCTARLEVTLDA